VAAIKKYIRDHLPHSVWSRLTKLKHSLLYPWIGKLWVPESYPSMELSLKALRGAGFRPQHCIDVGAYQGDWTRLFQSIFPQVSVLMIEAQESKREQLTRQVAESQGLLQVEIALLAAVDGKEMVFQEMGTGSSVLEEQGPAPRTTIKKISRTLDSVAASIPGFQPGADFIKLDVQGYELEVLKGASRLLAQCQAVLMEASFLPINAGCPLIYEVMTFMDEHRFRLVDFCSLSRRKDGVSWQTDLLFLKKDSPFLPVPKLDSKNWF